MNLSVLERLSLSGLLPQEGNYSILEISRKVEDKIKFSVEEMIELSMRVTPESAISWDAQKEIDKNFDFDENENALIVAILTKIDKENKMQIKHMSLFEKFVMLKKA